MKRSYFFYLAATLLSLSGCTYDHSSHNNDEEDTEHHEESGLTTVHLDSLDRVRLGIITQEVRPDTFCSAVKVNGEILPSATSRAIITAPSSGNLRLKNDIRSGTQLSTGESIGSIDMTSTSGASVEKINEAEVAAARREYERVNSLRKEGLATQAEADAALGRLESAKAALSQRGASGIVTSPLTGMVSDVFATNGSFLNAGDPIALVIASDDLTLRVDIPERHRSALSNISGINLRPAGETATYSIPRINISSRGNQVADNRGYIPLSISFPNPGMTTTGIYTDIYLLNAPRPGVISVPSTALIEDQGAMFVFVVIDDHEFERRMVTTGEFDGSRIEITHGLSMGESIAVEGVSMLRMAQAQSTPVEGHHHH